ncbi:MAG: cupin domain-containing protein [Sphingomicrobium sp.]|nr:cupin domain-containing protein [Sphingomonadales bacterium]
MPKADLDRIEQSNSTGYPGKLAEPVAGRWNRRLAPALGLTDFGASDVTLEPGAWSSQRHWHEQEDELVVMLEGEAVLIEDDARTVLRPGDIAAFPKGVANGHHVVNESDRLCRFICVGTDFGSDCHYPDADLHYEGAGERYVNKDGTPF